MKVNAVIAFMRVRIYKTTIILSDRDNCLDIVTPRNKSVLILT